MKGSLLPPLFKLFNKSTFLSSLNQNSCPVLDAEEIIKIILQFKEEQGRLGKKTNDYSGLQAAFSNELYVDGEVVRTRPTTKDAKE